jgi:hypothetical protein
MRCHGTSVPGTREIVVFTRGWSGLVRRVAGITLAVLALSVLGSATGSAQGLLEMLFGGFRRHSAPPPQMRSFADPFGFGNESRRYSESSGGGGGAAFCVRTCDGRFFPLQRNASSSPAELCRAFCPAAQTAVFHGSKIDHAVGPNGRRYADLDNAFTYRDRVVDNCTCNGKDAFGLVRIDVSSDPTLRPGDIVATKDGLVAFNGGRNAKGADFSPVNPSALPGDWGRRLSALKITPVAPPEKVQPVAEDTTGSTRKDRRRVHADR